MIMSREEAASKASLARTHESRVAGGKKAANTRGHESLSHAGRLGALARKQRIDALRKNIQDHQREESIPKKDEKHFTEVRHYESERQYSGDHHFGSERHNSDDIKHMREEEE
jgi:hypothetical protein